MILNDVKTIADNIDDFIEVPDGINRLRKAILLLAVSGKLIHQNAKEEKTPNIKSESVTDVPFAIPKSWKWVKLDNICNIQTGKKDANQGVEKGKYNFYTCAQIPIKSDTYSFEGESLILPGNGANVGYVFHVNEKFEAYQRTYVLNNFREGIDINYIFRSFEALWRERMGKQYGGAINFIKIGNLQNFLIPLPSLSEQKRIVKKVEEVMKQLDELEIRKKERDETRNRLTRSAMQSLGKGESKITLKQLIELVKKPEDIKRLEDAILTLAVSGKLVAQDNKEGIAKELYKDSGVTNEQELPFEIPKSWAWVQLASIGTTNIGLTYSPSDKSEKGIPVLRSSNIQNGQIDLSDLVRVKKEVKEKVLVHEGDLLICARNGSKALVGKTAMIRGLKEKMAFGAFMAIYRSPYNSYIEIFLKSPIFRNLLDGVNTMTINQITQDNLKNTILPLPPLAEQKRIVKKVEEIMVLINQLREIMGENKTSSKGRPKK
ncbi:MAG: restriction endonuclease subunit S [Clostridia bacterium]|jgi:type I restriction enzyme S subunit|nr:restriction endonuclease subunit S [Clostridia bacterium]